jgi:hypothetical protein
MRWFLPFVTISFLFLLIMFFAHGQVLAFAGVGCPAGFKYCNASIGDILTDLLDSIFVLASMIALLFLIWGGIRYMLARGDPKQIEAARNTVISAVIGLLVVMLSAAIFFLVSSVFKIEILGSGLTPPIAYAQGVEIGEKVDLGTGPIGAAFQNVGELFTRVVQVALAAAAVIFFAMIVWGGFRYLNAGGDPKEANTARQVFTSAAIGLLIVMASFVIIEILTKLAGQGGIF